MATGGVWIALQNPLPPAADTRSIDATVLQLALPEHPGDFGGTGHRLLGRRPPSLTSERRDPSTKARGAGRPT